MKRAPDRTGAALLAIAAAGVVISHPAREAAARWYADASGYNRSITDFVRHNRASLHGREVAVLGVSGMSPWSHTTGAYIARIAAVRVGWFVYVPREDIFYRFGRLDGGDIEVRPESRACADDPHGHRLYVIVDSEGGGAIVANCREALERAHPSPTIAGWRPTSVSARQARRGFGIEITGNHLGGAVDVTVDGHALEAVRTSGGRSMNVQVPARSHGERVVQFTVLHRGQPVTHGEVNVVDRR
jgi:hypothetical protein